MEVIIHRGTHQIGGCSTEIRTISTRIFIDFGAELEIKNPNNLDIEGLTFGESNCDGVLFTHYHGDHIGLIGKINENISIFMGSLTKKILLMQKIENTSRISKNIKIFEQGKSFYIGDIKITPFMIDHSAFDSYMFLIEAEGKKILHTGDFRNHGFRGKGLEKILDKFVGNIDLLISEGTVLNRNNRKNMTEYELSQKAKEILREYKYIFIVVASTNFDRLAAFSSGIPRGKYLLCDSYQKNLLDVVAKDTKKITSLYQFSKVLVYNKNLDEKIKKYGFYMFVRLGNYSHKKFMEKYKNEKTIVIYSMWKGYLENEKNQDFLKEFEYKELHTSGHADISALKIVLEKTNPKKIIPIHTENPEGFKEISNNNILILPNDKEVIII